MAANPSSRAVEPEQSGAGIAPLACLIGLGVGLVALLLLTNGGLALADFGKGSGPYDAVITLMGRFLAVAIGAYTAARVAGRGGMWQGITVAGGFIAVGAVFQFLQEAAIVHASITSGSHNLVDLGPMNMGSLMTGDLVLLLGGSLGGLLSGKR